MNIDKILTKIRNGFLKPKTEVKQVKKEASKDCRSRKIYLHPLDELEDRISCLYSEIFRRIDIDYGLNRGNDEHRQDS